MTWLNQLVQSRSELEAPLSFWFWAGLASISAIVKDQIWLDRQGVYKLYPNIYVMFHAESGLKKGAPVSMAKSFVSSINNTMVISGRSSIQGILKEMGASSQARGKPGGKIETASSSVFICSSELTSSIVEDKVATTILTDLYDRNWNEGNWRSLLKMESFKLNKPTVTMLTATNDAHSQDFFMKKDISGGYFARTFIVYEHEENRINSLLLPLKNPINDAPLMTHLQKLAKLKGQIQPLGVEEQSEYYKHRWIDPYDNTVGYLSDAGMLYQTWYHDFKHALKNQFDKDETGTSNRFGDSVLKVAILLSLAEQDELIITEKAMKEAIRVCEKLIGNIKRTTFGAHGLGDNAPFKGKIIMELLTRENHMISQPMLLKKMWMHYNTLDEFAELMNSVEAAGIIKSETVGNQIIYTMPDHQVEEFSKFFEGKMNKERRK